jgi:hypothetical protein
MFHFRRRARSTSATPTLLADECASFLSGNYLDHLVDSAGEVPPWAWINAAAHATPDELDALARTPLPPPEIRVDYREWRIAMGLIAGRVLATARAADRPVEEIQSVALVPIEFSLMSSPVGPRTTLRLVESALERTIGGQRAPR